MKLFCLERRDLVSIGLLCYRGRFSAKPVGTNKVVGLFELTEEGLRCEGISFSWEEIQGISIVGDVARIVSYRYISGGLRFYMSTCLFVDELGGIFVDLNGYPV